MSVGGIHPAEWIIPVVGMNHAIVNSLSKGTSGKDAVVVPGSSTAKKKAAAEEQQQKIAEAQKLSQSRADSAARPLTDAEEFQSRQRALSASEFLSKQGTLGI